MAWCMLTLGYNLSIAEPLPGHRTQGAIPESATCGVAKMTVSGIVTKFPQSRYPLWTESVCRSCVKGLILSNISPMDFAFPSRSTFIATKYNYR